MSMEQVLLTTVNSPLRFGSISIRQNVVETYTVDVGKERLFTQLSNFPAVLQAHNSSYERPISWVMKVATVADELAAHGQMRQLSEASQTSVG